MKIAIVIPTCNEERKPFLDFLFSRIERQTRKADHVILVDYPNEGGIDITDRFKKGLSEAISLGCDLIISMEDDDYYPLNYVENMERAWVEAGKPQIIGHRQTVNYDIEQNTYRVVNRTDKASAYCTAVSKDVDFNIDEQVWDYEAWRINKGALVNISPPPIGIKHGIGMTGGHSQSICPVPDYERKILKGLIDDEAYQFYAEIKEKIYA